MISLCGFVILSYWRWHTEKNDWILFSIFYSPIQVGSLVHAISGTDNRFVWLLFLLHSLLFDRHFPKESLSLKWICSGAKAREEPRLRTGIFNVPWGKRCQTEAAIVFYTPWNGLSWSGIWATPKMIFIELQQPLVARNRQNINASYCNHSIKPWVTEFS